MHTKTRLALALLAALGLTCTGALATTNSMPADPEKLQSMDITQPFGPRAEPVAKRGGTKPEDDGVMCDDDQVDNTLCVIGRRGGTMMEDDDGFDDNGVDTLPHALIQRDGVQVAEKGRGKDGGKPEDDGVDLDDACDDNGIDGICV